MRVNVGELRLFVEAVNAKLEIRDGKVVEKPTIVFLHGGPAWDHLTLRADLDSLADVAQLIFYDHRGLGRSDVSSPAEWTFAQWAADLHRLIQTLGIERPVIFGQSFGGMVAQRFAITYPDAYSALILSATAARFNLPEVVETFRRLGGDDLATIAQGFYTAADPVMRDRFLVEGFPFYTVKRQEIGALSPFKPDVLDYFFSDAGEARSFDFRAELARVTAPTLVLGGDTDPVISAAAVRELAASFAPGVARMVIFDECGHGPARDQPEAALAVLRDFISEVGHLQAPPRA
jgi:pimeloyl-ACP methyl ester carboxylesterase